MSEQQCPICKSDVYLNPDIVIYISPCFHRMCESCMYRIFNKGQAPCPECGTVLRKVNYTAPTFEDIQVERECKIRRMLLRAFRREEAEFSDNIGYNDYLEQVEDFVFELLDLKSESLVKERIKRIQDMGASSALNPARGIVKKHGAAGKRVLDLQDEDSKLQKTGLVTNYFNPESLPEIFVRMRSLVLPSGFLSVCRASGFTQEMLVSLAVSSLDNPCI